MVFVSETLNFDVNFLELWRRISFESQRKHVASRHSQVVCFRSFRHAASSFHYPDQTTEKTGFPGFCGKHLPEVRHFTRTKAGASPLHPLEAPGPLRTAATGPTGPGSGRSKAGDVRIRDHIQVKTCHEQMKSRVSRCVLVLFTHERGEIAFLISCRLFDTGRECMKLPRPLLRRASVPTFFLAFAVAHSGGELALRRGALPVRLLPFDWSGGPLSICGMMVTFEASTTRS